MKEATGELNMTLVVIVAVAAIMGAAIWFVPKIIESANQRFNQVAGENIPNKKAGTSSTTKTTNNKKKSYVFVLR